jgi:hypothetical protein
MLGRYPKLLAILTVTGIFCSASTMVSAKKLNQADQIGIGFDCKLWLGIEYSLSNEATPKTKPKILKIWSGRNVRTGKILKNFKLPLYHDPEKLIFQRNIPLNVADEWPNRYYLIGNSSSISEANTKNTSQLFIDGDNTESSQIRKNRYLVTLGDYEITLLNPSKDENTVKGKIRNLHAGYCDVASPISFSNFDSDFNLKMNPLDNFFQGM